MKLTPPILAVLTCTSAVASLVPSNYLRGGIDNFDICIQFNSAADTTGTTSSHHTICCQTTGAYCQGHDVCLDHYFDGENIYCDRVPETSGIVTDGYVSNDPCRYLTYPVDYEVCMNNNVTGCQDEIDRASKQCYKVSTLSTAMMSDWYVCSPASQCNTTATTTSSTVPNNTKRQVDGHECKEHTGADCINRDVCWDHYFSGKHYYYCEEPRENEPTTPPGPTCAHHNEECDPDRNESKQCCGALTCASVDGNVPERFRGAYGGIEYACLSVRENESGIEGDYYSSEA